MTIVRVSISCVPPLSHSISLSLFELMCCWTFALAHLTRTEQKEGEQSAFKWPPRHKQRYLSLVILWLEGVLLFFTTFLPILHYYSTPFRVDCFSCRVEGWTISVFLKNRRWNGKMKFLMNVDGNRFCLFEWRVPVRGNRYSIQF